MKSLNKKIAIVISAVFVMVVVTLGVILVLFNERKKSNTVETIMTFSVNPSIQIVLNKKDKVIDARATNTDGDKILSQVNFIGLTAKEAARLFVSISTEAKFIDVNTVGTEVLITLTGNKNDYTKLKNIVPHTTACPIF